MRMFSVSGMSCASCSNRVEKAVSKVNGVKSVSVSLLTNSMAVEGDCKDEDIIKAVEDAGYKAKSQSKDNKKSSNEDEKLLEDTETPKMVKRLVVSVLLSLVLMYFSMGVLMWHWPIGSFFTKNHLSIGIIELVLCSLIMVINQNFFISGFKALWNRSPNMDSLVALGSSVSFLWSLYLLLDASYLMGIGEMSSAMKNIHNLYFESASMILTFITVGKTLEAKSKGRTTDALKSLLKLKSKEAVLLVDGKEVITPIENVKKGDVFIVKSGEKVCTDGTVLEGSSAVDEASLTGESLPVEKSVGSKVYASTINQSGYLVCRADKVGDETVLSQIIKTVEETAATKAPISKIADRVSAVFVPTVMAIALVTTAIWLLVTKGNLGYSLARGISVLVISCPCALGLATPVAIMVGSGVGARNGILFKNATSLEELGKARIIALDKTGTITTGHSSVKDVFSVEKGKEGEVLKYASSIEAKSDHPLSKAIIKYQEEKKVESYSSESVTVVPGKGIEGVVNGDKIYCGTENYIKEMGIENVSSLDEMKAKAINTGASLVYVMKNKELLGLITLSDAIKEDSKDAIEELSNMGLDVVVITGDNENTAKAICSDLKVKRVIANVLPTDKANEVKKLKKYGHVIMVGDGINDSPALTEADVGISVSSGTDIAIDSSSVVLMKNSLSDVPAAIKLSRTTLRNIHENLFWAFIYNVIGIPIASGCFIHLFGWELNPMFGALSMSLSSFCVVSNALRLNFVKIYKKSKIKKTTSLLDKETEKMEKKMVVEGMMCHHCEMRVENALKNIDGVVDAKADSKSGTVDVKLSKAVSDKELKQAVEKEDYKVVSIK